MTRLENLVCAVLRSEVVKPSQHKIMLRVFGSPDIPLKQLSIEEYDAIATAFDKEIIERSVRIAIGISKKISDEELIYLEETAPRCEHEFPQSVDNPQCTKCGVRKFHLRVTP